MIEQRVVPFVDALAMVLSGEIVDSMTIIAILWADRLRREAQSGSLAAR